ncbi:MAG TPA: septal ring lytic transglycosylase RlpA family protein [Solirubrobacterales bacterium]|nr:septal ring lytic transglycosylase RlpA family protein [Solirubrobacterales bacterium]
MFSIRAIASGFFMLCAIFAFSAITAMTSPASALTGPTTLKVKVAPKEVSLGKTINVRGASGDTGRKPVKVLFRDAGTTSWDQVKSVSTDERGLYSTGLTARNSGAIKVAGVSGEASPIRKIRVRSSLKVGSVDRYVKIGDKLGIRGVVKPRGVRRIKIVIKGAGETIRTKTKAHGGFAAKWRPSSSGTYKVRVFSANNEIAIGDASRRIKVYGLSPSHASYYGPGLYGNGVACGGTLTPSTMGVAHKTLPCGTKVTIRYQGRTVTVPVIDRGPYIAGRDYDLTEAVRNKLGFGGVGTIWTNR